MKRPKRTMRIMVFGLRGFPGIEGGVETHAENLYPRLQQLGCQIEVIVRSNHVAVDNERTWRGVRFLPIWAPALALPGVESFVHSFLAVCAAGIKKPDVLHIHAVGPSLMAPLARLFGMGVVVTHHGPDYVSSKWGRIGKVLLELGEHVGMRFAHERIAVSHFIKGIIAKKQHCDASMIPNGVCVEDLPETKAALDRFHLESQRYVLMVSRFVWHKKHEDLIRAFVDAELEGWKLVLVGRLDSRNAYATSVQSLVATKNNVVMTNYQSGVALRELYSNAGIFVLPSAYEGLPLALLEALSYGILTLASDIPAHLEIGLPAEQYFPLGDTKALCEKLREFSSFPYNGERRHELRLWVKERYDWQQIAERTLAVYRRAACR